MKQVKKVVIYYTDGTYQEVDAAIPVVTPSGPVKRGVKDVHEPFTLPDEPYVIPGQIGKWPYPPDGIGTSIVD